MTFEAINSDARQPSSGHANSSTSNSFPQISFFKGPALSVFEDASLPRSIGSADGIAEHRLIFKLMEYYADKFAIARGKKRSSLVKRVGKKLEGALLTCVQDSLELQGRLDSDCQGIVMEGIQGANKKCVVKFTVPFLPAEQSEMRLSQSSTQGRFENEVLALARFRKLHAAGFPRLIAVDLLQCRNQSTKVGMLVVSAALGENLRSFESKYWERPESLRELAGILSTVSKLVETAAKCGVITTEFAPKNIIVNKTDRELSVTLVNFGSAKISPEIPLRSDNLVQCLKEAALSCGLSLHTSIVALEKKARDSICKHKEENLKIIERIKAAILSMTDGAKDLHTAAQEFQSIAKAVG